jgi:aminoglycoside phosphotransferase (APT) family kinase protein
MGSAWDADVDLTPDQAASLIDSQFRPLAPARLVALGVGWDNTAYLVNGTLVFRFPRRRLGADLIANEARCLAVLAPRLPLPVPVPSLLGAPAGDYPYPFSGYRLVPGTTACAIAWTGVQRARAARPLGAFLAALHSVPAVGPTSVGAPRDSLRRADTMGRAPALKERLSEAARHVDGLDPGGLAHLVDSLASAPPHRGPPCWVHGDLYTRHLLVDQSLGLCGVIDWGDVHLGDPALDLSIAISFLPECARPTFEEAYGPVDGATWRRARFRALHYGALLVAYGASTGDGAIRAVGEYALLSAAGIPR